MSILNENDEIIGGFDRDNPKESQPIKLDER